MTHTAQSQDILEEHHIALTITARTQIHSTNPIAQEPPKLILYIPAQAAAREENATLELPTPAQILMEG